MRRCTPYEFRENPFSPKCIRWTCTKSNLGEQTGNCGNPSDTTSRETGTRQRFQFLSDDLLSVLKRSTLANFEAFR